MCKIKFAAEVERSSYITHIVFPAQTQCENIISFTCFPAISCIFEITSVISRSAESDEMFQDRPSKSNISPNSAGFSSGRPANMDPPQQKEGRSEGKLSGDAIA